jgi:hypothetical protein
VLVVEQLKQAGNVDTTAEQSKAEASRNSELNADQPKSEPMARDPSNDVSCSTPSPPLSPQKVYTPPSPNSGQRRATFSSDSPPLSPLQSVPSSPTVEKPGVRFTNPRGNADKNGRSGVYRSSSKTEFSTIDQKWGRLFDRDRNPTQRLGQFLRGLANHIVSFPILQVIHGRILKMGVASCSFRSPILYGTEHLVAALQ